MRKRIGRDELFVEITNLVAQRSTCWRKQVGAIVVKDRRIITTAYNGPPSGFPHCTKETCKGKNCDISIHAEMNAIAFAAKSGVSIEGSTMYCTMSPCINCAKVILNSGIVRVVYFEEYRLREGIELLERGGVKVEKLYREYFSKD